MGNDSVFRRMGPPDPQEQELIKLRVRVVELDQACRKLAAIVDTNNRFLDKKLQQEHHQNQVIIRALLDKGILTRDEFEATHKTIMKEILEDLKSREAHSGQKTNQTPDNPDVAGQPDAEVGSGTPSGEGVPTNPPGHLHEVPGTSGGNKRPH